MAHSNLLQQQQQEPPEGEAPRVLPAVKTIIAIASGKGGVGKSTVSANLAAACAARGLATGLLDADIYGPSIPKMYGAEHPRLALTEDERLIPWRVHDVSVMSLGFLVTQDTPVIWRGPMVHNLLTQFIQKVAWGTLDLLFVDLPPGTGDAQLTITQSLPLRGAVIVTTPQEVSIQIASRGLKMFRDVDVPILGMIENMSTFHCPQCQHESAIFRAGGTQRAAEVYDVPFLGAIPIDPQITSDCDDGRPTVLAHPDSRAAHTFSEIAQRLVSATSST
jgi:ATP-binding protein involved in chromosome partitioning